MGFAFRLIVVVLAAAGFAVGAADGDAAAYSLSAPIAHSRTFILPRTATHVALHWRGHPRARVRVAFSADRRRFSPPRRVLLDEAGEVARDETFGAVMRANGARAVRVWTSVRLKRLTVLALRDRGPAAGRALASVVQAVVVPRSAWGADESLRFDGAGNEIWPPAFWPIQKLIVHHTATQNGDPDPAATVRSIYYYHAVTQGWGDIGYNFLIDEAGRIYEGRYSRVYAPGESPTGEDLAGNGVTAGHAYGYNAGTVGIALLGTLTNRNATPAARDALDRLLAWIADTHAIDPQGSSLYTNPVNGTQAVFPNIAGHRDVGATECPGGAFYSTLPSVRSEVAALIAGTATPDFAVSVTPSSRSVKRGRSTTYAVSISAQGGFADSVTLSASGLPAGATAVFSPPSVVAPGSSTLTVRTTATTARGTFTLTVRAAAGSAERFATTSLSVK